MRMPGVVTGTMVRWNHFMGKTRVPRCLIEANGMIVASNSSSGTVGCLLNLRRCPTRFVLSSCPQWDKHWLPQSIQLGRYFV